MISISNLTCKLQNTIKFRNTLVEQVRYRTVNTKRPVSNPMREIGFKVTKPKYVKPLNTLPLYQLCSKAVIEEKALEAKVVHPLDQIIANEVCEQILKARLVVIFQMYPRTPDQFFDLRVDLNKVNLTHVYHTRTIIRLALQGTPYESLLKLYESHSVTFVSPEAKFNKFLKMSKKYPFISLVGGVFDKRVISVTDFKNLASNPSIEGYQSELCGLLSASSQNLSSHLSRHQQELCISLQQYITDQSEKKDSE